MKTMTLFGIGALLASTMTPLAMARTAPKGRGQLFISPMGAPYRATQKPGAAQALWFAAADTDGDGRLTADEFERDAMRFFATLDRRGDGEIDPDDIDWYENILVPEIRVRGRARTAPPAGPAAAGGARRSKRAGVAPEERLGAGRFGLFDLPEPVTSADTDLNRGVDTAEFAKAATERFAALDRNRDGAITRHELPRAGAETWRNAGDLPTAPPTPDAD